MTDVIWTLSNGAIVSKDQVLSFFLEPSTDHVSSASRDTYPLRQAFYKLFDVSRVSLEAEEWTMIDEKHNKFSAMMLFKEINHRERVEKALIAYDQLLLCGVMWKVNKPINSSIQRILSQGMNNSVWIRNIPAKWLQIGADGAIESTHELHQVLSGKYGQVVAMEAIASISNDLNKDICIKFQKFDGLTKFLHDICDIPTDDSSSRSLTAKMAILRRSIAKAVFFIHIEVDETNFLSDESIRERQSSLEQQMDMVSEIVQSSSQMTLLVSKYSGELATKRTNETSHKEFSYEVIMDMEKQFYEVISKFESDKSYIDNAFISNNDWKNKVIDMLSLHTYHRKLKSYIKDINSIWKKLCYEIDLYVSNCEEEVQQQQRDQRQKLLEEVLIDCKDIIETANGIVSHINDTTKKYNWSVNSEIETKIHRLNMNVATLNKVMTQRQEGSQRYLTILNKSFDIVQENIIDMKQVNKVFDALSLFQDFQNKTKNDIQRVAASVSIDIAEANPLDDVYYSMKDILHDDPYISHDMSTKDELHEPIKECIESILNQTESYSKSALQPYLLDRDDDNQSSKLPFDEKLTFQYADTLHCLMKYFARAAEVRGKENETIRQYNSICRAIYGTINQYKKENSEEIWRNMNIREILSPMQDRYRQYREQVIESHSHRKRAIASTISEQMKAIDTYEEADMEASDKISMRLNSLRKISQSMDDIHSDWETMIFLYIRESNRLLDDLSMIKSQTIDDIHRQIAQLKQSQSIDLRRKRSREIPIDHEARDAERGDSDSHVQRYDDANQSNKRKRMNHEDLIEIDDVPVVYPDRYVVPSANILDSELYRPDWIDVCDTDVPDRDRTEGMPPLKSVLYIRSHYVQPSLKVTIRNIIQKNDRSVLISETKKEESRDQAMIHDDDGGDSDDADDDQVHGISAKELELKESLLRKRVHKRLGNKNGNE